MKPRAPAAITACVVALACSVACAAACGGRVDGGTSTSGGFGGASSAPGERPPGTGTGRPKRPPPAPLGNAAVASMIAEDYCKAFSACCVGDGQPPIDVARCRVLTSAAVEKELDAGGASESSAADVAVCVAAIHTRIAACGTEDARFPGDDLPLFQPALPSHACMPLLPNVPVFSYEACSASSPCAEANAICAIDACTSALPIGSACMQDGCVDTASCVSGKCAPNSTADVGAVCTSNDDCRLGLVCFEQKCAPTRDHPELAKQRSSPYRIGADTCRAYNYL